LWCGTVKAAVIHVALSGCKSFINDYYQTAGKFLARLKVNSDVDNNFMFQKTLELSAQAPQATTDLHRISLGLESGLSDQCVYSLCCFDACMIDGLVTPVKDEGLWNRCESSLLKLLHSSASGPLLLHVLHTLSFSLQMSDPESDAVIPRLVDILVRVGDFTIKERMLALRCLSVLELDDTETAIFQRALLLIIKFGTISDGGGQELLTLSISLMCRYVCELPSSAVNEVIIPSLLKLLSSSTTGSSSKLLLACVGLIHLLLENKPDSIQQTSIPRIVSVFIDRLGVSPLEPSSS